MSHYGDKLQNNGPDFTFTSKSKENLSNLNKKLIKMKYISCSNLIIEVVYWIKRLIRRVGI